MYTPAHFQIEDNSHARFAESDTSVHGTLLSPMTLSNPRDMARMLRENF